MNKKNNITSNINLTQSVGRGGFYQVFGGFAQTVIRIGASTFLARVLLPYDFGIFGLALLFAEMILRIGALGMGIGIIAKHDLKDEDLSTAFWTMAVVRVLMFAIAFGLAPIAALFFGDPRVTNVVRAISFTFLFQIIGVIGFALLRKKLLFFQIFIVNVSASFIEAIIAITIVVFYRKNFWALVIAMVLTSFFKNFVYFFISKWKPKFSFNVESFRYLFRYGINSLGTSLASYFNENIDYLIVGKLLGPKILGLYEFAYRIPNLIENKFSSPLKEIMLPGLALVKDSNEKLTLGYVKGAKYITLICFPAIGGLAILAEFVIRVLWGETWLPIVLPLQVLCIPAAIKCLSNPVQVIFICKDRPDIPFKFSVLLILFTVISVGVMGYLYGITGVAFGMLITSIPNLYLIVFAFKMLKTSIKILFISIFPIIFSTTITMVFAYFISKYLDSIGMEHWISLISSILGGCIVYIVTLWFGFRDTWNEIVNLISTILGLNIISESQA